MARFSRLRQLLRARKDAAAGLPAPSNQPGEPTTSSTNGISPHSRAEDKAQPAATDHPDEPPAEDYGPWADAFRDFEIRQPELAADYLKHLNTFHAGGSSSSSSSNTNRQQTKPLSDTTSAAPLIQHLLADREKKQWRVPLLHRDVKIRAQVEKLTRFCLYTNDIVKQALSCQPHAALAWSAVSILLPLLAGGNVQHDAMLGGFEYIGTVQLYWRNHERHSLPPTDGDLRDALTKLYSRIVEYQAKVICHLSSAQLSRLWHNVTDTHDWEGGERGIAKLNDHCRRLVSEAERADLQRKLDLQLAEMQESRALLSDIRRGLHDMEARQVGRHDDERESALLRDLASDYEHYKNVHPPRVPGTCEWLLNDEGFRRWRGSTVSSLLWISAGPGCGKSVLARCLVDEGRLSDATDAVVCYFFFQTGVEGCMDACDAVAALLHQVFVQDQTGELIRRGLASHKNHGSKLRHNFAELWRILIACAASLPSGEIVCVLDALDECREESREELLRALDLSPTPAAPGARLKFLVTSRPYDILEGAFEKHTGSSYLRVDGDDKAVDIGQEINLVIDTKVGEMARDFSEDDRRALSLRLKTMENRTYLWLHLTFDIIKRRRPFLNKSSRMQELLGKLPARVSDAYEAILNQTSDDPDDRAVTRALLELVLASTRPLTLEEANHALTLRMAGGPPSSQEEINDQLWPGETFKNLVKNLSGLLITVCDSRLSFIHLTAREFLSDARRQGQWQGTLPMTSSHHAMASVCLDYLSAVDPGALDGAVEVLGKAFPFLPYSIANWTVHYNSQHEDGRRDLCAKARKLCDVSDERGERLVQMYCECNTLFWTMEEAAKQTEFNLACALGLMLVVKQITNETGTHSQYAQLFPEAIEVAAWQGHADIVRFLGNSTDRSQDHDASYSVALTMALCNFNIDRGRQLEVVKALLDHSVDARIMGYEAVESAMYMGGKALVSMLMERLGDDIQMSDHLLGLAVSNPDRGVEVTEWLLDHRREEFHVSEDILVEAAGNYRSAAPVFALLLRRCGEIAMTGRILIAAAENQECGGDLMALFLERFEGIHITEEVIVAAAGNYGSAPSIIELLLKCRGGVAGLPVTNNVMAAMAGNAKFGSHLLQLLLDRGCRVPITTKTLEIAAANAGCGAHLTKMLMDQTHERATVSARAVENAAGNKHQGREVLQCLLKYGRSMSISPQAMENAASNIGCGTEVMEMLLETDVPLTPRVVVNAVKNQRHGKALIELLVLRRPGEVCITEEVLSAAKNVREGEAIMAVLRRAG